MALHVAFYAECQVCKGSSAADAFRQVLKLSPQHPLAVFDLGLSLFDLGQNDEAIRWLTAAVREDPKAAGTHYYLGVALERTRRFPEARASLQKAIELNPQNADAYAALSRVYSAQREPRLAQESMAKALALNPRLKQ